MSVWTVYKCDRCGLEVLTRYAAPRPPSWALLERPAPQIPERADVCEGCVEILHREIYGTPEGAG